MNNKPNESAEILVATSYFAEKVLKDLRADVTLDDDLIAMLHTRWFMDYFREQAGENDARWLMELAKQSLKESAKKNQEAIHKFAVGILKDRNDFSNEVRAQIKKMFEDLWENYKKPTKIRLNLMWRLLDYGNLSLTWHKKIYQHVINYWDDFIETQRGYMGEGRSDTGSGDPELVLPNLEKRLKDPKILPSKYWAYLCSAMASNDIFGIYKLFYEFQNKFEYSDDTEFKKFYQQVIKDLYLLYHKKVISTPIDQIPTLPWKNLDLFIWDLYKNQVSSHSDSCSSQPEMHDDQLSNNISDAIKKFPECQLFLNFIQKLEVLQKNGGVETAVAAIVKELHRELACYRSFARDLGNNTALSEELKFAFIGVAKAWEERYACLYNIARHYASSNSSDDEWFHKTPADPCLASLPIPSGYLDNPDTNQLTANIARAMHHTSNDHSPSSADNTKYFDAITLLLGEKLRLLQWEVMPRDHFEWKINRRFWQVPKVKDFFNKPGLISPEKHQELADAAWRQIIEKNSPSLGKVIDRSHIPSGMKVSRISEKIENILKLYLDNVQEKANLNKKFIRYVQHLSCLTLQKEEGLQAQVITIEDGELTFYCLWWHLRKAMARHDQDSVLQWIFGQDDQDNQPLTEQNRENFLCSQGLLCPIETGDDKRFVPTPRFHSFVFWFLRYHEKCRHLMDEFKEKNNFSLEKIEEALPVKVLTSKQKAHQVLMLKLLVLLCSEKLANGIRSAFICGEYQSAAAFFQKNLCGLKEEKADQLFFYLNALPDDLQGLLPRESENDHLVKWLFSRDGESNDLPPDKPEQNGNEEVAAGRPDKFDIFKDTTLLDLSRTCFLPLEEQIRRYQPYPISLLVIPYDFRFPTNDEKDILAEESFDMDKAIPTSLVFATVFGQLEYPQERCSTRQSDNQDESVIPQASKTMPTCDWRDNYWNIFQPVSSAVNIRAFEEMSGRLKSHESLRSEYYRQGHELKRIIASIDSKVPESVLTIVREYFYGVVLDRRLISSRRNDLPSALVHLENEKFENFLDRIASFTVKIKKIMTARGEINTLNKFQDELRNLLVSENDTPKLYDSKLEFQVDSSLKNMKFVGTKENPYDEVKILYSAMVSALLLNIHHNCEIKDPVKVELKDGYIMFRNTPDRDAKANCKNISEVKEDKFGGTEASLESYVRRFLNNRDKLCNVEPFTKFESEDSYLSAIPAPQGIWFS